MMEGPFWSSKCVLLAGNNTHPPRRGRTMEWYDVRRNAPARVMPASKGTDAPYGKYILLHTPTLYTVPNIGRPPKGPLKADSRSLIPLSKHREK